MTPKPDPPPVWSELTNLPSSITLYGLWAPRADLVMGVGKTGDIWQWDGQRWTQRVNPSAEDLYAIAGSVTGTVVAVGNDGTVLTQVQGSFIPVDATVTDDLRGVWRSDSGLLVAVGANGSIIRGDGSTWSADATPTPLSLFSVWGASDTDIFAGGVNGTIIHYDGAEWTPMSSGTTEILAAISGTSADDVYAVGGGGTILHYDGTAWTPMTSPTTMLLQSVCADCGPAAVGVNGTVLRMVDGLWQRGTIPGAPWLYAIARAGDQQWAAGAHALFRYDGMQWSNENRGTVPILRAITSSATNGIIAVGDNGMVLRDGPDHWRIDDAGALQRLNAVYAAHSGEIFAAGTNRIFRYTETGWAVENSEIIEYFDLGGTREYVFAVGSGGAIRRYNGATWEKITRTGEDLHAVGMTGTGGYIAGNNGNILLYDGVNLEVQYTRAGTTLWDVMPVETGVWRAIAVGAGGVSLGLSRTEGLGWTVMPTQVATALYSLAFGPGDDLFAAGVNGTILRLVNDQWTAVNAPVSRTFLNARFRNGALFLCGGNTASGGMLFRYGPPHP